MKNGAEKVLQHLFFQAGLLGFRCSDEVCQNLHLIQKAKVTSRVAGFFSLEALKSRIEFKIPFLTHEVLRGSFSSYLEELGAPDHPSYILRLQVYGWFQNL